MEITNQFSAYTDSYRGLDGLLSILNQNIISGKQTEFPFRFTINIQWSDEDTKEAISQIGGYSITFENGVWEIGEV